MTVKINNCWNTKILLKRKRDTIILLHNAANGLNMKQKPSVYSL